MTTFKLSPSSLSLMHECPRCFWLKQHKIWPRPSTPFPQLPNGMDRVLKTHFDKFRDNGMLPPEIRDHRHTVGLKLFGDKELIGLWRSRKGIQWEDKNGNILHGAVDNLLMNGKKMVVLDYKTKGGPLKDEAEAGDYSQNQLDFYNFLLRKNNYETEDYAFLLFYYPKEVLETGEVIFDTVLARREINVKNAEKIFNKALKLLSNRCPKKICVWCEGR
ncbi:PD-(D/E)XK nuclease family protein [Candidatus Pacearchaeota archaeon]|nr:PD-(D/E)XK nuclease family protein [Candidatus Pacearchaeota archaeon]